MNPEKIKNLFPKSLDNKYNFSNSNFRLIVITLLLLSFILIGIDNLNFASNPQAYDTTAYLGEANFIKNHGGIFNFINLCITGKYIQANQHPLYILLITPFASRDISFFINAKIISVIVGLILLFSLYIIAKKMFGELIASIAVFGLILNDIFFEWISIVASESLLMLFCLLCMYFILKGFKNNKYWIYAGIFMGLAYLSKGTALFLIPGFIISCFLIYRIQIFKNKYFWLFFILFVITASPLFIRNIVVYKNPFFNVNDYIITYGWDKLRDIQYVTFDPNEGVSTWKFDKSISDTTYQKVGSSKPNKILNIIPKAIKGIGPQSKALLYSLSIFQKHFALLNSVEQPISKKFWFYSSILLLFFIIGISREKDLVVKIYIIATILSFLIGLSFFRPLARYSLPLIPIIWLYIALGIIVVLNLIIKYLSFKYPKITFNSFISFILILCIILNLGYIFTKKSLKNPLKSVKYSESRLDLLNFLRTHLHENEKYTLGPNFHWQLKKGIWILPPDNVKYKDFTKFRAFIEKYNISYIIFEWNSLRDKKELAKEYFTLDPNEGIIPKKPIDFWKLVYKDKEKPVEFLVYRNKINDL